MKKQRAVIFVILCTVLFSVFCSCSIRRKTNVPDQTDAFYVYDEANVLDTETKTYIVGKNVDLYDKCGGQIVVACVNTTGNYDIKDYAYALFNKWKIGSADKNNGVLILLSIDEDDYWVLQGNGLETLLQSGTLKLMLNDYLEPYFAKKQYADGVRSLFDALIEKYEQIYSVSVVLADVDASSITQPVQQPAETGTKKTTFWGFISAVASIIIAFTVIVIILIIVVSIAVTVFIIIGAIFSGGGSGAGSAGRAFRSSGGININPHSFRTSSFRGGTSFGGFTGSFNSHRSGGFSSGGSHRSGGFSSGSHGGFSSGSHGGGFSGGHHSGGGGFSGGGGAGRR